MFVEQIRFPTLPALAALAAVLLVLRLRGRSGSFLFFAFWFGAYLLLVARGTLFPIPIPDDWPASALRNYGTILEQVHLVPLSERVLNQNRRILFFQLLSNILLTVPIGFGINFLARVPFKRLPWLLLACGLTIEVVQLAVTLLVGLRYRVVDINDVLMNTAGALAGWVLFQIFAWIYRAAARRLPGLRP